MPTYQKLQSNLHNMEKAFEIINNDRNRILAIKQRLIKRIKELHHMLESNGDVDLQIEFEALHKILGEKLPKGYEALKC